MSIFLIGGSKGGVGKSAVSGAVIDTLIQHERPVFLVEADTSNPDVAKTYGDMVETISINLDHKDGWMELMTAIHAKPKAVSVVINTPARNNEGIKLFGDFLTTSLPELKRDLVTLWVINRQRDSLELLKKYRSTITAGEIHVVRNNYFGTSDKFQLFNDSELKKEIEASGGSTIDFPDLADRVADIMNNKRMAISKASVELDFGEKIELLRWRSEVSKVLWGVMK